MASLVSILLAVARRLAAAICGRERSVRKLLVAATLLVIPAIAQAAPIYVAGTAASCATCTFGTHLAEGPLGSVAGTGGSGLSVAGGATLDQQRTYIYDQGGWADGTVTRGDADFAMMVWDVGTPLDTVRLYTHQDHYNETYSDFLAQDFMEYSVWGSNDNQTFTLLSDVISYVAGADKNSPTYTFFGTEPTHIYRGGSAEFGTVNAYTRDYTFGQAYQYYGIRTSSISLDYCLPLTQGQPQAGCIDADPELDAVAFNRGPISTVPEPATLLLFAAGLAGAASRARGRRV
jgi:hypothetical protein